MTTVTTPGIGTESTELAADTIRQFNAAAENWPGYTVTLSEPRDGSQVFVMANSMGGRVRVQVTPLPEFTQHQGYGHPGPLKCEGCR